MSCPSIVEGSRGVWYTGSVGFEVSCLTLSTEGSRFDTILAVYKGDCNNLECVTENDDSSNLVRSSEVSFTAFPLVTYYIYVGGVNSAEAGDYRVSADVSAPTCAFWVERKEFMLTILKPLLVLQWTSGVACPED